MLDTETTSLDYMQAEIVGISVAVKPGSAAYIPVAHDYPGVPRQLKREHVLDALKPLLEDKAKAKIGQNLKYDAHVLFNHGITLRGITHDTMLQSYIYNSTATKHNMDDLAKHYLGINTIHYETVAGKGAKQIPFQEVALEQATPYAAEDADITLRLHQTLYPKLQQQPAQAKLYNELEIPLLSVIGQIERNGVLIDSNLLAQQSFRTCQPHRFDRTTYARPGRTKFQSRLAQANSSHSLRQTTTAGAKKNAHRATFHRRIRAARTCGRLSFAQTDSRTPQFEQAKIDLRRQAAATD